MCALTPSKMILRLRPLLKNSYIVITFLYPHRSAIKPQIIRENPLNNAEIDPTRVKKESEPARGVPKTLKTPV